MLDRIVQGRDGSAGAGENGGGGLVARRLDGEDRPVTA